jgi:hypothetical protein
MKKFCCDKMKTCLEFFESYSPRIGPSFDGDDDISGSLEIDKDGIHISDGWNDIPTIDFNFCPYCGTKLTGY